MARDLRRMGRLGLGWHDVALSGEQVRPTFQPDRQAHASACAPAWLWSECNWVCCACLVLPCLLTASKHHLAPWCGINQMLLLDEHTIRNRCAIQHADLFLCCAVLCCVHPGGYLPPAWTPPANAASTWSQRSKTTPHDDDKAGTLIGALF